MKRFQLLITILFSIFIFSSLVYAQPCKQKGITNTVSEIGLCLPWLNLTIDQQTQITALHNSFNKETVPLQKELSKKRLKMNILLLDEKIDDTKAFELQAKISELTAKIEMRTLKGMLKAYVILTAEQREQLPAGCSLGFGNMNCGQGPCMTGRPGMGGSNTNTMGRGRGLKQGRCW